MTVVCSLPFHTTYLFLTEPAQKKFSPKKLANEAPITLDDPEAHIFGIVNSPAPKNSISSHVTLCALGAVKNVQM